MSEQDNSSEDTTITLTPGDFAIIVNSNGDAEVFVPNDTNELPASMVIPWAAISILSKEGVESERLKGLIEYIEKAGETQH